MVAESDVVDTIKLAPDRREYGSNDLGHFGLGLKAASFGHADVLTVWSSKYGAAPIGRRIRKADFSKDFSCQRLSTEAATVAQAQREKQIDSAWGTSRGSGSWPDVPPSVGTAVTRFGAPGVLHRAAQQDRTPTYVHFRSRAQHGSRGICATAKTRKTGVTAGCELRHLRSDGLGDK